MVLSLKAFKDNFLCIIYKMYVRKARAPKKRNRTRKPLLNKKIARIAKSVALRTQETKHVAKTYGNHVMLHNVSRRVDTQLLRSNWGAGDGFDNNSRIGDEVTLRGLKVYLSFEQRPAHPNITFTVWILKMRQGSIGTFAPLQSISGNLPQDPVNMETVTKVLYRKNFRFDHKNTQISSHGGVDAHDKTVTYFRQIYLPLNNAVYHYNGNNVQDGRDYNIAMYISAFEATGSSVTSHIADVGVSTQFFYKDA